VADKTEIIVKAPAKPKPRFKTCPAMVIPQLKDDTVIQTWSENSITAEFNRVKISGWLPLFQNAATAIKLPTELLLAIASRETNMRNIKGDLHADGYHGFGIMQVDIGTDREFCCNWDPTDVQRSIERGAQILALKKAALAHYKVTSLKSIIAAYNAGEGTVIKSIRAGEDVDTHTKGGNYASDVLRRMAVFAKLLKSAGPVNKV
jgi:soluble lytic murein transglycosylase-like protein